jgi:3-methyladenine DNA glycosylase AlkC
MAEPLKNYFDERIPRTIAKSIEAAWPQFRTEAFLNNVLVGYQELELMDRGRHIARTLRHNLPESYPEAVDILLRSTGERPKRSEGDGGMASFLYLPHVQFVAEFGLDHFEDSMRALFRLTQLFTAEFSIRPFLERYQEESLALLRQWARDPNWHVRRLVSEGTRPRLPWASRLPRFQKDPTPVLELLELLTDDPDPNVRRSVANNLNDIGKDHPDRLVEVAARWRNEASEERLALVKHALRSLVKQGHSGALQVLGFGQVAPVEIAEVSITPKRLARGGAVTITFSVRASTRRTQRVLADLRVHFVKANGKATPKVFKLRELLLENGNTGSCRKTISLADLTTRKHYPGEHKVEALLNGMPVPLGSFEVLD